MRLIAFLTITLAASVAMAQQGPMKHCGPADKVINALGMDSSRAFEWEGTNSAGGWNVATLWIELTDANSSITRFDATCTVSHDNNTSDYTPQDCTAGATCTSSGSGVWQKATPGTAKWPWRVDITGFYDFECTFSVGTGSGAAADTLTVYRQLCVE